MEFAGFKKEQTYANNEDEFVYHNKNAGIVFHVDKGEVESIRLLPTISFYSNLFNTDEAKGHKKYFNSESYFLVSKLENRNLELSCDSTAINDLVLSKTEVVRRSC